MKIALVILNWNGKELLKQFLPTMVKYSSLPNVEIIIADNASTDESVQFVMENFPTIQIIQNKSNGGYAKGYNDALKHVKADVYGLINSDIEVTENWLETIISTFEKEESTAIIQPKILDFKNKTHFEYAGAAGGFIDELGYPYCRGRIFSEIEIDSNQYKDSEIFWASGACFFIRSKVFNQLKGFDEDYFAHQEEIDLCWRAHNFNHTIKYINNAIVYHVGGATLNEESPKKTFLNFRNSLFSLLKNLPKRKLFSTIFLRLVLDGIAGVKFLAELKPKHTFAIIKAHFSFYFGLKKMYKKRRKNGQKNNFFNIKSIVWQHYIVGKKTYKEL